MQLFLISSLLLAALCGQCRTRSVEIDGDDDDVIAVKNGALYALEPSSGVPQYRLTRRHLGSMDSTGVRHMRLDLGPDVEAIDMELTQDSAWTDDSMLVVRRGDQVEEIQDSIDKSCFLSGPLTSHDGAATINRCGRLSGMVLRGDVHYEIEEDEDGDESQLSNVKVVMRRANDINDEDYGIVLNDDILKAEAEEEEEVEEEDGSPVVKRQGKSISAEVAVYLDANFAKYMSKYRNKKTTASLTKWLISKWNVIRNVFADVKKVGVPFSIQLKKVEVWWKNPSYYAKLGSKHDTIDFLRTFCQKTDRNPNYDHKMLYTQGTGQSGHLGLAYLNGICRSSIKCSLVKAKTDSVKIELHEFGHNIGLEHDPDLKPCDDPKGDGGFMGWGSNYRFLDCYRRDLLKHVKEGGAKCLYQNNVSLDTLNPSADAKKKSNKKKEENKTCK